MTVLTSDWIPSARSMPNDILSSCVGFTQLLQTWAIYKYNVRGTHVIMKALVTYNSVIANALSRGLDGSL